MTGQGATAAYRAHDPVLLSPEQMDLASRAFARITELLRTRAEIPNKPVLLASVGPTKDAPLAPRVDGVPVSREAVLAEIDRQIEECGRELAALGLAYHRA